MSEKFWEKFFENYSSLGNETRFPPFNDTPRAVTTNVVDGNGATPKLIKLGIWKQLK